MPDTQDVKTVEDEDLGIASEYDAFISYKHGPVDSAAAKAEKLPLADHSLFS